MRVTNTNVDYPDEAPHPSDETHNTRLRDPQTGEPLLEVTYLQQLLRARYATAGLTRTLDSTGENINELVTDHVNEKITNSIDSSDITTNLSVSDKAARTTFTPRDEDQPKHEAVEDIDRREIENPSDAPPVATKRVEQLKHKWKQQIEVLNTTIVEKNREIETRVGLTHDYVENSFDDMWITVGQIYEQSIKGNKYAITGIAPNNTRRELKEKVAELGGNVTESVSSKTDYLVVGENPGERKQQNAETHGTETIGAREFVNSIENLLEKREENTVPGESKVEIVAHDDETFNADVGTFAYDTPLLALIVGDNSKEAKTTTLDSDAAYDAWLSDGHTYPLVPWYGTMVCPCHRYHDEELGICKHEMYALVALNRDEIEIDELELLPQRFKRFVHPRANRVFRNEVI